MASENKTTFCVNSLVAQLLHEYIDPTKYDQLKAEILQHTYVLLKWKLLKNPACQNEDPAYSKVYRVLFVNDRSVIVQIGVEGFVTRFGTFKIMLADWSRVFIRWAEKRGRDWDLDWVH